MAFYCDDDDKDGQTHILLTCVSKAHYLAVVSIESFFVLIIMDSK